MPQKDSGLVLLEVVVAFMVLFIGALPLIHAMTVTVRQLEISAQRTVALELAQGKLEEITGQDFASIGTLDKTNWPENNGAYQFSVQVGEPAYGGKLKNICVTVYYLDHATGREKKVTLTGAVAIESANTGHL